MDITVKGVKVEPSQTAGQWRKEKLEKITEARRLCCSAPQVAAMGRDLLLAVIAEALVELVTWEVE